MTHIRFARIAAALVIASTALVSACSESPGRMVSPTSAAAALGAQGDSDFNQSLAAVRRATAAFHDFAVAQQAGYQSVAAEPCVSSPAGTMGKHSINPALIQNPALDITRPEILVYLPTDDGLKLVAVEYMRVALVRRPDGTIAPWFPPTPWPANHVLVTPTPVLFGQSFQGPMAGHGPPGVAPWHYDLHAWVWAPNPAGDFAQFNPRLSCPGA